MRSVEYSAKFELIFLFYFKDEIRSVRINGNEGVQRRTLWSRGRADEESALIWNRKYLFRGVPWIDMTRQ